jgi:hypothetical protein
MVIILLIIAFMVASTVLVIAAGMLSSRLSRQENWIEEYEKENLSSTNTIPKAVD